MSFFKKLTNLFSAPAAAPTYLIKVRCNRCGEEVQGRVNLHNDVSIDYGEGAGKITYFCRKILMGENQCFQQIEVELTFDQNKKLKDRQVYGGQFVD
jgi:hypothetical protein